MVLCLGFLFITSIPSLRMSIEFLSRVNLHPLSASMGSEMGGFSYNNSNMCVSFSFYVNVNTFMSHF